MFPTTVWTTIHAAGDGRGDALERVATRYRPAVQAFLRGRGLPDAEADDVCQDVFVRVLSGGVLAKADPERGRFRSLLLSVTRHVMVDRLRKRREDALGEYDVAQADDRDDAFDREWVLHLSRVAMERMEEEESPFLDVLRKHLAGVAQDRRKLWQARRKLIAMIRREIAMTCATHQDFEDETAYLSRFLAPSEKKGQKE